MQPYAIIFTGGKQYTVKTGDIVRTERIPGLNEGDSVELPALAAHNGTDFLVGTPELDQKVKATVMAEERARKIIVQKWKRRKQYRKRVGHRQSLFALRIDALPGN